MAEPARDIRIGRLAKPISSLSDCHDADVCHRAGMQFLSEGRPDRAMHAFERAAQIDPTDQISLSHYALCRALTGQGLKEAVSICRVAAKAHPEDAIIQRNLGWVCLLRGNRLGAVRALRCSLGLSPDDDVTRQILSEMGIRRPPVIARLPRGHILNQILGRLRARFSRPLAGDAADG